MKILWVCNVPIPKIANDLKVPIPNICGWLTGFANSLIQIPEVELHICFPLMGIKQIKMGQVDNIQYYAFSQPQIFHVLPVEDQVHTSKLMVKHIKQIIDDVQPDILHIFGTEYPHALVAARAFNNPAKTVVNVQGMTSFYWMHFNLGMPFNSLKKFAISNIARGNLLKQAEKLKKRGELEIETIKNVNHVIGRTDWDKACTTQINPAIQYHFCNESLRDVFYDGIWNYNNCEKYSIFMSQAATPIKGLQFMLRALPEIIHSFPKTHLYIAGNDLTKTDSLYAKLKISSFALYIKKLIHDNHLDEHVTFTGSLNEQQMKERFMKSNVFVLPSTIENSPNSLGEAMLLGLPCIASDVGGVKNLMEDKNEGYIYQSDAPYMLSYYVKKVFSDPDLSVSLGKRAKQHALKTHDRGGNLQRLIEIYYCINKDAR